MEHVSMVTSGKLTLISNLNKKKTNKKSEQLYEKDNTNLFLIIKMN